jgi:hypothetical protein
MAVESQRFRQGAEGNFELGSERYPSGRPAGGVVGSQHGEEFPFNNWFPRKAVYRSSGSVNSIDSYRGTPD